MTPQATSTAPTRRRTQEERSVETCGKLIDATVTCICELGYASATTTEIARRAGLSRGAVQHHFGTRLDLLVAVIDHLSNEMLRRTEHLPALGLPLEQRIDAMLQKYWGIFTSRTFLAVLNIFLGARSEPDLYVQLRSHMADIYRVNDRVWHTVFADMPVPREQLVTVRRLVLATLRGLAVAQLLGLQDRRTRAEFDLLRNMVHGVLAGATAHAGTDRAPSGEPRPRRASLAR